MCHNGVLQHRILQMRFSGRVIIGDSHIAGMKQQAEGLVRRLGRGRVWGGRSGRLTTVHDFTLTYSQTCNVR